MSHEEVRELLAIPATGLATSAVLAHESDPVAIFGFFGPALLLALIVIGAVIWDRRRHGGRDDRDDGVARPDGHRTAGDAGRRLRPPAG